MPTTYRRANQSVITHLLVAPQQFQFTQAVRLLLDWLARHGVPRDQALLTYLRFDNSLSLGFPASQIEQLSVEAVADPEHDGAAPADAHTLRAALLAQRLTHLRITPAFFGLLGNHGVLPSRYTERIADQYYQQGDASARAFLDLFSGRAVTQFYQAWSKYRIEQHDPARHDGFAQLLLALAGKQPPAPYGVAHRAVAYYAGLLTQRPMSACAMARILSDHFGVPIAIDESVGHMNHMRPSEQSALGLHNVVLGDGATIGPRMWRPDLRARLRIGPLDRAGLERFLPGSAGAGALKDLLALLGNALIDYEIALILRRADVRGMQLDSQRAPELGRLGYDSYLHTAPADTDRADAGYELQPMAPLPNPEQPAGRWPPHQSQAPYDR